MKIHKEMTCLKIKEICTFRMELRVWFGYMHEYVINKGGLGSMEAGWRRKAHMQ